MSQKFNKLDYIVPIALLKRPFQEAHVFVGSQKQKLTDFTNQLHARRQNNLSDPKKLIAMQESKAALFAAWGMSEADEPKVCRGLVLEAVVFTTIAVVPLFALLTNQFFFMYWIAAITTSPACLLIALTKVWRYDCIKAGKLTLFKHWLWTLPNWIQRLTQSEANK